MRADHGVRYACQRCGTEQFLPEPVADPSQRVRAGCDHCETITSHTLTYRTYGVPQ